MKWETIGPTADSNVNRPPLLNQIWCYIPNDLYKYLESIAREMKISVSMVFCEILREYIESNKRIEDINDCEKIDSSQKQI